MQSQRKSVKMLDDRIKTREEIAEMIKSMMNTDDDGNNEKKEQPKAG